MLENDDDSADKLSGANGGRSDSPEGLAASLVRSYVRAQLEASKAVDLFATWLLAVIGATLTLFVGNVASLAEYLGGTKVKAVFSLLLVAGLSGLAQKYLAAQIQQSVRAFDKFIDLLNSSGFGNPLANISTNQTRLNLSEAEEIATQRVAEIFPEISKRIKRSEGIGHGGQARMIARLRRQKAWLFVEVIAYAISLAAIILAIPELPD